MNRHPLRSAPRFARPLLAGLLALAAGTARGHHVPGPGLWHQHETAALAAAFATPPGLIAVWEESDTKDGAGDVVLDASRPAFQRRWMENTGKGLRLVDLETYVVAGERRWAGVFAPGKGDHFFWVGLDWPGFAAKWKELSGNGLRLVDLETYVEDGKRRWAGVFRAGTDAHAVWAGADGPGFTAKWKELSGKGLRLVDVETYVDSGERRWAGVFRAGTGGHALWAGTAEAFHREYHELGGKGLRLADVTSYRDGDETRYVGVWRAGAGRDALRVDWCPGGCTGQKAVDHQIEGFEEEWKELAAQGLRLVDLEMNVEAARPAGPGGFTANATAAGRSAGPGGGTTKRPGGLTHPTGTSPTHAGPLHDNGSAGPPI